MLRDYWPELCKKYTFYIYIDKAARDFIAGRHESFSLQKWVNDLEPDSKAHTYAQSYNDY